MPDFEALIRHQQLKQPNANQRLKIVDKAPIENSTSSALNGSNLSTYFLVGFLGALIGCWLFKLLVSDKGFEIRHGICEAFEQ